MKKKHTVKRILSCIITAGLTLCAVDCMGVFLDPPWISGPLNVIDAFHSLEEDSMDVIVYGSSHSWKGFSTAELYEKYGIEAYNYGCSWQHINTTDLFLKDSLRTQSPQIALIETFNVNNTLYDTELDGEIYYTRSISMFDGKWKYLKQCFGNNLGGYLSYWFPIVMFHDNWSQISSENFVDYSTEEDYLESRGYETGTTCVPAVIGDYRTFEQYELGSGSRMILDDIVGVCKENNIEIIFYTAPYEGEFHYSDALKEYCQENDCTYINLFEHIDEVGIDGNTDFRDETHLNDSGAIKVADYLGSFIMNNYDFVND